jgi:hypothetical protein
VHKTFYLSREFASVGISLSSETCIKGHRRDTMIRSESIMSIEMISVEAVSNSCSEVDALIAIIVVVVVIIIVVVVIVIIVVVVIVIFLSICIAFLEGSFPYLLFFINAVFPCLFICFSSVVCFASSLSTLKCNDCRLFAAL